MTTPTSVVPEIPRDRWGRPKVRLPDNSGTVSYTRCTTFVGVLEDTFNLSKWQQRMVAAGLSQRPDLLLAVSAHGDDKKRLDALCEQALEAAKATSAATTGTALHALTERIDRGEELGPVPESATADLQAYERATTPLTPLHIEQFTVYDPFQIGGTPDRIVEWDGRRMVADIKTGSIDYGILKIAMQLAVYAHSVPYDHVTHERSTFGDIDTDRAIIIHLPAGQARCELVEIDIGTGWDAVHTAREVREWRRVKNLTRPLAVAEVTPTTDGHRGGSTYDAVFDYERLNAQARRVFDLMSDGGWRGLSEIAVVTGDPEASVSARLRDFRKPEYGSMSVERKTIGDRANGYFVYRLDSTPGSGNTTDQPTVLDDPTPPAPVNDQLANDIASAATVETLTALWSQNHTRFTPEHVELAKARKALLTEGVV